MLEAGVNAVHSGLWTDWEKSGAFKSTLTLPNRNAAVLLAFLATIVGLAATRSWRLSRFILYNLFLHEEGLDGQPSTAQVVLRNSETAGGAGFDLLFSFRHGFKDRFGRKMAVMVAAFGHWIFFIVAGILTSQIFLGRTVISKVTPTCGDWRPMGNSSEPATLFMHFEKGINDTMQAEDYVRNCYDEQEGSRTVLDCGKLRTQSIPYATKHNDTCPFQSGVCRYNDQSAFTLDTGKISFASMGLNCKRCHELSFRRKTTCAPIKDELFFLGQYIETNATATEENPIAFRYSFYQNETGANQTHDVMALFKSQRYLLKTLPIGILDPKRVEAGLRLDNATHQAVLVTLTNALGLSYDHPTDDPFFNVVVKMNQTKTPDGFSHGLYASSKALAVLGCDEQMQFCSEKSGTCEPLHSILGYELDYEFLAGAKLEDDKTVMEIAPAALVIYTLLIESTFDKTIGQREGGAMLLAAKTMIQGGRHLGRLSREQWKLEVNNWFAIAMARLQLGIFATIERRPDVDASRMENRWTSSSSGKNMQSTLCGNIKYRSPSHTSLSFFGIMFVIIVSLLLIIASCFDVVLVGVWRKWMNVEKMERWDAAENIALLRQAKVVDGEVERRSYLPDKLETM